MSQMPLFGDLPPEEPTGLPPAKMPYDKPAVPSAVLRAKARPCSACGQLIVFPLVARTAKGVERARVMPVDVDPDPAGTVHIWTEGRSLRGHVFGRATDRKNRRDLHKSHFATCPQAGQFRQRSDH